MSNAPTDINSIRPWRTIERRKSRQIMVGKVPVGGDAPIAVQSMTNTVTHDVAGTIAQIRDLEMAGADIVRVSVPDPESAEAMKEICHEVNAPIVADIHFHYKRGIEAAENGAACLRINPGNIGGQHRVREVVAAARDKGLPVIVIDLNPTSVIEARKLGIEAYVGDSTQPAILHLARLKTASALVITLPDHRLTTAVIVEAKSLVDDLRIIARARYHRYFGLLEGAGATTVIDEETQVGRRMADYLAAAATPSETPAIEREKDKEKDVEANAPPDLFAD